MFGAVLQLRLMIFICFLETEQYAGVWAYLPNIETLVIPLILKLKTEDLELSSNE